MRSSRAVAVSLVAELFRATAVPAYPAPGGVGVYALNVRVGGVARFTVGRALAGADGLTVDDHAPLEGAALRRWLDADRGLCPRVECLAAAGAADADTKPPSAQQSPNAIAA